MYSLEIVKRTGDPENPAFERDFESAVEHVLNRPGNNNTLVSCKFQRNCYYALKSGDVLKADYVAFVLWKGGKA